MAVCCFYALANDSVGIMVTNAKNLQACCWESKSILLPLNTFCVNL